MCFKKQKYYFFLLPFFDQNFQRKKRNPHQSSVIFLPRRIPFFFLFPKRRSHEIYILFPDYVCLKLSFKKILKIQSFLKLKHLRRSLELMMNDDTVLILYLSNNPMVEKRVRSVFSDRISGIPNLCCPKDKLVESSTSERCNGSEKHGYTFPKPLCTPRWWRRPGWLGTRCTGPWCGSWLVRQSSPFILIVIAVAILVLNSEHKLSKKYDKWE